MKEKTYAEQCSALQSLPPEEQQKIFDQEWKARERPIQNLFHLAMQADKEQKIAFAALPEIGNTPEDLANYNRASDEQYLKTWYAPEIYAEGLFTALYTFNMGFAQEVCGLTEKESKPMRAGSTVLNGVTFHEIVCTVHGQICHFSERARIGSAEEARTKNRLAAPSIEVLEQLGLKGPYDSAMSFSNNLQR